MFASEVIFFTGRCWELLSVSPLILLRRGILLLLSSVCAFFPGVLAIVKCGFLFAFLYIAMLVSRRSLFGLWRCDLVAFWIYGLVWRFRPAVFALLLGVSGRHPISPAYSIVGLFVPTLVVVSRLVFCLGSIGLNLAVLFFHFAHIVVTLSCFCHSGGVFLFVLSIVLCVVGLVVSEIEASPP